MVNRLVFVQTITPSEESQEDKDKRRKVHRTDDL